MRLNEHHAKAQRERSFEKFSDKTKNNLKPFSLVHNATLNIRLLP